MTVQANTRKWQGATLSVRNSGNSAWVDFAKCLSYSFPGEAANQLPASTAESTVDEFILDIRNLGTATFEVFDDLDNTFLTEMFDMATDGETRDFKLTMSEGTNKKRDFTGYVSSAPITGRYRDLWKMSLSLRVVEDYWWKALTAFTSIDDNTVAAAGGDTVNIVGAGFVSGKTMIKVGTTDVTPTVTNSTHLSFVTPAHAAGTVVTTIENFYDSITVTGGLVYS